MINQHKPVSVLRQPYVKNRMKHFLENLISLLLILITISSLCYATANLWCANDADNLQKVKTNTLVPAIYIHDIKDEEISL
ncbi:MAG: hypothetical protein RBR22_04970 [Desulfuromonas sp.]|nr:hypothetical protein [Desulfuromonas sp.]